MCVLAPEFHFNAIGLFLVGMPPHGVIGPNYAREHGRFDSEGINNHVHLPIFTNSRIAQFEIGVRTVKQWILAISNLRRPPRRATIYLTGTKHFVLCVYSNATDDQLRDLEQRIGGKILRASAVAFNSWAFGGKAGTRGSAA
jgi:hypothetical protein